MAQAKAKQSRANKLARFAVSAMFTFAGATMTIWAVHLPVVEQKLNISSGAIALVILSAGMGALSAMQLVGALVDKIGSKPVVIGANILAGLALMIPALATDLLQVCLALFVLGFALGSADISMNAHAVDIEKAYGRPIFSAFHAFWSIGGVIGASVGAAALAAEIPMPVTLGVVGLFFAIASASFTPLLLDTSKVKVAKEDKPSKTEAQKLKAAANAANKPFLKMMIALGVMGGAGALIEGVGIDWSALHGVNVLGMPKAEAALSVVVFSSAMAAFRFVADKVVEKFGRIFVIRWGGALSAAGIALALTLQPHSLSLVGWLVAGLGVSAVVPQIFAYSATVGEESHSGRNMAKVFGLTYAGMLGGPAIIGWLASLSDLGTALWVGALLGALIALGSLLIKNTKQG